MIDKQAIEESGREQNAEFSRKENRKKTKKNLRTLVENSSVSKVRSTGRIVKYGTASFVRNIWLSIAATLVMTVTLVILMITVAASLILSATADTMKQKIDITIFFKPGTEQVVLDEMADTMKQDQNVKTVDVSDSLAEYQSFIEQNKDNSDLLVALEDESMYNLMLSSMQATMRIKVYDPNDLSSIKNIVEQNEVFQANLDDEKEPTYDVNHSEIETINTWATMAKNGGLILGAVFLVISVLVIFNTIRMAIFSRREEIYMMKLVGADVSFIRGPFRIEAQICGIISGILASILAVCGFRFLRPHLENYGIDVSSVARLLDSSMLVIVFAVMIGIGVLIGTISARLAIRKYLR